MTLPPRQNGPGCTCPSLRPPVKYGARKPLTDRAVRLTESASRAEQGVGRHTIDEARRRGIKTEVYTDG